MDLTAATDHLGLVPTRVWRGGMPRADVNGAALPGVYAESYWTAPLLNGKNVLSSDVSLDEALSDVVSLLASHREFLNSILGAGRCECFIGLFASDNFGIELPVTLMKGLVDLGVSLGIDAYP